MFNKVKLKKYLIGMFAAIILMSAVITAAGVFGILQQKSGMRTLVYEDQAADSAVKTCRIKANIAARDLREMLITEDQTKRASMKANRSHFSKRHTVKRTVWQHNMRPLLMTGSKLPIVR